MTRVVTGGPELRAALQSTTAEALALESEPIAEVQRCVADVMRLLADVPIAPEVPSAAVVQAVIDWLWERRVVVRAPTGATLAAAAIVAESRDIQLRWHWGVRWVAAAYPTVDLATPQFVAALLCSGHDPEQELRAPWPAFLLRIPPGTGLPAELIMVARVTDPDEGLAIVALGRSYSWWQRVTVAQLCAPDFALDQPDTATEVPMDAADVRVQTALRALVRSVLAWVADPERVQAARVGPSSPKAERARAAARRGLPLDRYVLTAPIRIDARPVVAAYLAGERARPGVRSLVRGFWRRQACGAGRVDRVWRWIEPHWRGGEDLPIAVRVHRP